MKLNDIKFFIGPMSKNIVDTLIEFCTLHDIKIGIIPSRRQIEFNGGYVNNWKTFEFAKYVKSKTKNVLLVRDHSGPQQGIIDDDGYESLEYDCKFFDVIHIDPWKKFNTYDEGLLKTIEMINFCYNLNQNILFEVGTEESIRRFELHELEKFICDLKKNLRDEIFNQIKYLVIQSGTSLNGTNQTGNFDSDRLKSMVAICKNYGMISKEHNGDYLTNQIIKEKFDIGLDSINIAPEFGVIETMTYLENINDQSIIDDFYNICFKSKKWEKWVTNNFLPEKNKIELIKICGHYVFSQDDFLTKVKSKTPDIDKKIKNNILIKLNKLYGL